MNQGKFRRICMESSVWITSIWALKCFQEMHSIDDGRHVIYSYPWLLRPYFLFCQNYWEVNITCCLNDSSSRSLSEANLWLSRRTSRSASSPCKVIVCMMFRSNSNVLINIPPGHGKGSGNGAIGLNYGRFATKSFRRIMKSFRSTIKSIRCNQLLVLNSLKQFRMNYING